MRVSFTFSASAVALKKAFAVALGNQQWPMCQSSPKVRLAGNSSASFATWLQGTRATSCDIERDGICITIKNDLLEVSAQGSVVRIRSLGQNLYLCEAEGSRHSFAKNLTGRLGESLLTMTETTDKRIVDLKIESSAAPWDLKPGRLFRLTIESEIYLAVVGSDGVESLPVDSLFGGQIRSPMARAAFENFLQTLHEDKVFAEYYRNSF